MGLQVIRKCGGSGIPIFKPQAQSVLIDRPPKAEAVRLYLEYVCSDLRLAMLMAGRDSLVDVNEPIMVQ